MDRPLLSESLWKQIATLLPPEQPRPHGGRPRLPNRAALEGILYVLETGTPWEHVPLELGLGSGMTCLRRLRDWQSAGAWPAVQRLLVAELAGERLDWSRIEPAPGRAGQRRRGEPRFRYRTSITGAGKRTLPTGR